MYTEYWGLQKQPFENTNDPAFLYSSRRHKEGLARMHYAVQQKKLGIIIIGEYGTGKTFLSRALRGFLPPEKYKFVYITNPQISPLQFLKIIAMELGDEKSISRKWTKPDFLNFIEENLENYHERGMYVVIFFDEVQSIQNENLLEEIRLLFNLQSEDYPLFTLILMGQPAVEVMVGKLPQLKQRLSIKFELTSLTEQETREYIDHRLTVAGATRRIFSSGAYTEIYSLSKGMPRAINNICDLALLTGFVENEELISEYAIQKIQEDMGGWLD